MSLSDPIGDMIARIKNANLRNYKKVLIPSSKFKKISDVLKNEGYIIDYKIEKNDGKSILIDLKYNSKRSLTQFKEFLNLEEEYFQALKVCRRLAMD